MKPWIASCVLALVAASFGCFASTADDLPAPAQGPAPIPEIVLPAPPAAATPWPHVVLSAAERTAIENLRRRGASIAVSAGSGDVLVHFPLGKHERVWRKQGLPTAECGLGIEYSFTPDDTGPPMTDSDLVYLDGIPRLARVNLAGTLVTAAAIDALRKSRPAVTVEDRDE